MKLSEFKTTEEVLERAGKCATAEELVALALEYDVELTAEELVALALEYDVELTPDELVALAQEYGVELTAEEISDILKHNSLKELSDEQLDLVAGGDDWGDQKAEHLPPNHGRHIGRIESENYIGKKVYCVDDDNTDQFCWGILERSYETHDIIWMTKRVYDIRILGWNHDTDTLPKFGFISNPEHIPVGEVFELINSSRCTLFLYDK